MKITEKIHRVIRILIVILIIGFSYTTVLAQGGSPPPPPPPGAGSNTQANKLGGSAPIGSGLLLLLSMGVAYGGKKIYNLKKRKLID